MEIFYFKGERTPHLHQEFTELYIPEGQPFILDQSVSSVTDLCLGAGIDWEELCSVSKDTTLVPVNDVDVLATSYERELNDYLKRLTAGRKSRNTWKADAEHLCMFLRWVKKQDKSWREITVEDMETFYHARRLRPSLHTGRPISSTTWNACVGAVSRFYQWALEKKHIESIPFTYRQVRSKAIGNIMKNTLTEPIPDEPVRYLTIEEYKVFRKALGASRNGVRDSTFGDFLVKTGLRVSEGSSFTLGQLPDPDAPRYQGRRTIPIPVTRKGGKKGRFRMPKTVARQLERYVKEDRANVVARSRAHGRFKGKEPSELWLNERGDVMTPARWEEIFAHASAKCKIFCTPHMLRHTFAIYTLSELVKTAVGRIDDLRANGRGMYSEIIINPLNEVKNLLGHKHIETTFIYLDTIEECQEITDDAIESWTKEV